MNDFFFLNQKQQKLQALPPVFEEDVRIFVPPPPHQTVKLFCSG